MLRQIPSVLLLPLLALLAAGPAASVPIDAALKNAALGDLAWELAQPSDGGLHGARLSELSERVAGEFGVSPRQAVDLARIRIEIEPFRSNLLDGTLSACSFANLAGCKAVSLLLELSRFGNPDGGPAFRLPDRQPGTVVLPGLGGTFGMDVSGFGDFQSEGVLSYSFLTLLASLRKQQEFGSTPPTAAGVTVPEPSALALLGCLAVAVAIRRRARARLALSHQRGLSETPA